MHSASGVPEQRKEHATALTVPFSGARWGLAVQFEALPFRVSRVYGDGEAKRAGVSVGDVITHVEGQLITVNTRPMIEARLQSGGALAVTFNGPPNEQQSFGTVLAQLQSSGFFTGYTKGTHEYTERLQKVKTKFYTELREAPPQRDPNSERGYLSSQALQEFPSNSADEVVQRSETSRNRPMNALPPRKVNEYGERMVQIGDWYKSTTHGPGKVTKIQTNKNQPEYVFEFNNGKILIYSPQQVTKFLKPANPPDQDPECDDLFEIQWNLHMWSLSRGGVTCPGGHKPDAFLTPTAKYVCDVCKKRRIPKGTVMYGCRQCNWDVCRECKEKKNEPVRVANVVSFTGQDWGFVTEFRRFPWVVIKVRPGAQADQGGVNMGDTITHVDGVKVSRGYNGNKTVNNISQITITLKAGGNHRVTFNGDCGQCEYILSNFPAEMESGKSTVQVVQELQVMFAKIGASTTDRQGDKVFMVGMVLSELEVREMAISFQEIFESTEVVFEKKSKVEALKGEKVHPAEGEKTNGNGNGNGGPAGPRSKDPKEWTVNQVCAWLTQTGRKNTAGTFLTNEVTGDMLFDLDLATLMEDFGMDRFPSRSALKAIETIRPTQDYIQQQSPPGVSTRETYTKAITRVSSYPTIRRAESAS